MDIASAWNLFCVACAAGCIISLALYLTPLLYLTFIADEQNLLEKYGNWAVVTGGSSGIGKAVARKLAAQGVNVCIVALEDNLLTTAHVELEKEFPKVEIRVIPVNLASPADVYMREVKKATDDIPVSILINNAGFLVMGFFDQRPIETHMANLDCNATSAIRLTYHFYKRMIDEKIKGCIAFTSSAAFFMPSPFAIMYGATKALLSHFATSLAIEAENHGIDVTVFHPSYTHSNLYASAPKFGVLNILSKFGWTPEDVASVIFKSVGRIVVRDLGAYAVVTNLLSRFVDTGFLTMSIIPFRDSMAPPSAIKKDDKNQ